MIVVVAIDSSRTPSFAVLRTSHPLHPRRYAKAAPSRFVRGRIIEFDPLTRHRGARSEAGAVKAVERSAVQAELSALFKTQHQIPRAVKGVIEVELAHSDNDVSHLSCLGSRSPALRRLQA